MDTVSYYSEKARQCRRLTRATNDERAIEGLTALAEEFQAKAKAAQACTRTIARQDGSFQVRMASLKSRALGRALWSSSKNGMGEEPSPNHPQAYRVNVGSKFPRHPSSSKPSKLLPMKNPSLKRASSCRTLVSS